MHVESADSRDKFSLVFLQLTNYIFSPWKMSKKNAKKAFFPWMLCLTWYYSCAKVTKNYLGILLALKFQEDYSTEQHHCIQNYYGDN